MKYQGNRMSKQGQELDEMGFVPPGALELATQGPFGGFFLHDIQCHVSQHREVVWAMTQSVPVLVFIHHDIAPPTFFLDKQTGRMARSTLLLSSSMRPSSRNRSSPSQWFSA